MSPSFISHSGAGGGEPSAHELRLEQGRILLDCGTGGGESEYLHEIDRPDAVWISHAHADHCGGLLDLIERWPRTPVLATGTTKRLLNFALGAQNPDVADRRIEAVVRRVETAPMRRFRSIPGVDGVELMALPAGHVPGAAMAVVEAPSGVRALYTGDFCTHDQAVVSGAGIPSRPGGFAIDAVVSEAVLANDEEADAVDWSAEAEGLAASVESTPGPVVIGVSAIAQSVEVAAVLTDRQIPVVVDDYLRPVFEVCEAELSGAGEFITFARRNEMAGRVEAGAVAIAPGERFRASTPAARLAGLIVDDPDAAVAVVGRARSNTPAGQLVETPGGETLEWRGGDLTLRASVIRRRLIDHAPRWQLEGFLRGIAATKTFLVHATDGARWGLKRAIEKGGFDGEIVVTDPAEVYAISPG